MYLDEDLREPIAASEAVAELIRDCCLMLAEQLSGRDLLEAAE